MLPSLKAACLHSATIAWGYVQIFMAALVLSAHQLYNLMGTLVTDPQVKASVESLHLPVYAGLALAVFGAITVAARLRTVTQPTDENNQVVN